MLFTVLAGRPIGLLGWHPLSIFLHLLQPAEPLCRVFCSITAIRRLSRRFIGHGRSYFKKSAENPRDVPLAAARQIKFNSVRAIEMNPSAIPIQTAHCGQFEIKRLCDSVPSLLINSRQLQFLFRTKPVQLLIFALITRRYNQSDKRMKAS